MAKEQGEDYGMETDKQYDALKAKQEHSVKSKAMLAKAGYARGGGVGRPKHEDEAEDKKLIKKELEHVKITPKKHGGKIDGKKAHHRADKFARGGKAPSGKHTKIAINIGAGEGEKKAAMVQGMQLGAHMAAAKMAGAARPGAGAPMQARGPMPQAMPPAPGAPMGGAPQGVPPTMQKRGGRTYATGGGVKPLKMEFGAGGAKGRLEKKAAYGTKAKK